MQFADLDITKTYAYSDYLKWTFDERMELIKGKIFKMSPAPGSTHQRLLRRLSLKLGIYLTGNPCELFFAPFDVRLPRRSGNDNEIYTVVQPDLCVICDGSKVDEKGCLGAPDIVVEILSPGNNKKELKNKYEVYEEAGILEYWIIYPPEKTLLRYVLVEGRFQTTRPFTVGDEVTTPIFPGFVLNLDDFFDYKS
jgi:Uma2 family endonuclease